MPRLTELATLTGAAPSLPLRRQPSKPDARALTPNAYRLSKDVALVETTDVLAPVVDDAKTFGRIAAAHALGRVWASGGKPLFARHFASWPADSKELVDVLAGAEEVLREAKVTLIGHQASAGAEARYGLSVTGTVTPKRLLRETGARNGDLLFLTKPLGSGIAATAIARGEADKTLVENATGMMLELNRDTAAVFASGGFKVSGLGMVGERGLLGQLLELLGNKHAQARLYLERLPIMEGIPALAGAHIVSDAAKANLAAAAGRVAFPEHFPTDIQWVLADPQINGGLLAAVPWQHAKKAMAALNRRGLGAAPIGEVTAGEPGIIVDA